MAITLDTTSSTSRGTASTNRITWTHVTSTAASVIIVGYAFGNDPGVFSTAKYAGTTLTELGRTVSGGMTVVHFGLLYPADGANLVELRWANATRNAGGAMTFEEVVGWRNSYASSGNSSGTLATTVVDSEDADMVVDCMTINNNSGTEVVGAGQTAVYNRVFGGTNQAAVVASYEPSTGPNTVMSWVSNNSGPWSQRGIALFPAFSGRRHSMVFI